MSKITNVETDRLTIRELKSEDLQAIHNIRSNKDIFKYVIWGPITFENTKKMLDRQIDFQKEQNRKVYVFAVTYSNNVVGECFLVITDHYETAEIGYYFHPEYWGNGYALETVIALLKFGFTDLGLHRIFAKCDSENIGSINVLTKAGFRLEGELKKESKIKGEWRDSLLFAILEEELM
ncbi:MULTISPECIES: GNAT family protein [unclassified Sutcliffiella]|uniref:GNAT family N-acetyltransferase n=1 Tax=unclassified Sutcliffiella TaxID=2837532 RepID=UPI0030CE5950